MSKQRTTTTDTEEARVRRRTVKGELLYSLEYPSVQNEMTNINSMVWTSLMTGEQVRAFYETLAYVVEEVDMRSSVVGKLAAALLRSRGYTTTTPSDVEELLPEARRMLTLLTEIGWEPPLELPKELQKNGRDGQDGVPRDTDSYFDGMSTPEEHAQKVKLELGFDANGEWKKPPPPGKRVELQGSTTVKELCERMTKELFGTTWSHLKGNPNLQVKIYDCAVSMERYIDEEMAKSKVDHPAGRKGNPRKPEPALGPNENGMRVITLEQIFAIRVLLEQDGDSFEPAVRRAKDVLKGFARD